MLEGKPFTSGYQLFSQGLAKVVAFRFFSVQYLLAAVGLLPR
jgi:hypothetical protein